MGAVVPRKGRYWTEGRVALRWLGSAIGPLDPYGETDNSEDYADYEPYIDGRRVAGTVMQFVAWPYLVWEAYLPSDTEGQGDLEVAVREDGHRCRRYRNARELMRAIQKEVDGGWQPCYHEDKPGDPDAPLEWWDKWEDFFVDRGTASDRVRRAREARA